MGCGASSPAMQQRQHQERIQNMMGSMMQLQQQQLEKQQQMIRDDPECKRLFDKHMELQGRIMTAMQTGDRDGALRAQKEAMELQTNPKYLQMMMPDMNAMRQAATQGFRSNNNGGGAANATFSSNTTQPTSAFMFGNNNDGMMNGMFGSAQTGTMPVHASTFVSNSTPQPSAPVFSSNGDQGGGMSMDNNFSSGDGGADSGPSGSMYEYLHE